MATSLLGQKLIAGIRVQMKILTLAILSFDALYVGSPVKQCFNKSKQRKNDFD